MTPFNDRITNNEEYIDSDVESLHEKNDGEEESVDSDCEEEEKEDLLETSYSSSEPSYKRVCSDNDSGIVIDFNGCLESSDNIGQKLKKVGTGESFSPIKDMLLTKGIREQTDEDAASLDSDAESFTPNIRAPPRHTPMDRSKIQTLLTRVDTKTHMDLLKGTRVVKSTRSLDCYDNDKDYENDDFSLDSDLELADTQPSFDYLNLRINHVNAVDQDKIENFLSTSDSMNHMNKTKAKRAVKSLRTEPSDDHRNSNFSRSASLRAESELSHLDSMNHIMGCKRVIKSADRQKDYICNQLQKAEDIIERIDSKNHIDINGRRTINSNQRRRKQPRRNSAPMTSVYQISKEMKKLDSKNHINYMGKRVVKSKGKGVRKTFDKKKRTNARDLQTKMTTMSLQDDELINRFLNKMPSNRSLSRDNDRVVRQNDSFGNHFQK